MADLNPERLRLDVRIKHLKDRSIFFEGTHRIQLTVIGVGDFTVGGDIWISNDINFVDYHVGTVVSWNTDTDTLVFDCSSKMKELRAGDYVYAKDVTTSDVFTFTCDYTIVSESLVSNQAIDVAFETLYDIVSTNSPTFDDKIYIDFSNTDHTFDKTTFFHI